MSIAGTPAIAGFIPKIWSSSILRSFERSSTFANVLSRDYFGELQSQGDIVRIPKVSKPQIRPYVRNQDITYDLISGETMDFQVDNANYFALLCDDLDAMQSTPAFLDAATKSAGLELAMALDRSIGENLAAGAGIDIDITDFTSFTTANVIPLLAKIATKLDENDVPVTGRWLICPPTIARLIGTVAIDKKTENSEAIADGFIARLMGFDIFMSNNCPKNSDGDTIMLAGTNSAGTLIAEVSKTETLRHPNRFSDIVRGYLIWGSGVLLPEALAKCELTVA